MPHPPVVDRPLFFLDYDGTLAPIVDQPDEAFPHPAVPALARALSAAHPVWIVTGRHLDQVAALMPGVPLRGIGLHGTQEGVLGETVRSLVEDDVHRAMAAFRETVPEEGGIWVEEKGPAFAVHYRRADDVGAAQERLRAWLDDLPETLEAIWGKRVVELKPKGLSKGTAVRRLAEAHPEHTPLYLGDDVTDEDAFRALGGDAVTVKVGEGDTVARYRLPSVDAVVAYLRRYV